MPKNFFKNLSWRCRDFAPQLQAAIAALHAVRAHLLEMAGDGESAIAQYHLAATRTASTPERQYLLKQAARLSDNGADGPAAK